MSSYRIVSLVLNSCNLQNPGRCAAAETRRSKGILWASLLPNIHVGHTVALKELLATFYVVEKVSAKTTTSYSAMIV